MERSNLKTKDIAPLLIEESKLFSFYLAAEAGELGFRASPELESKIKVDEKLFGKNSVQVVTDLKVLAMDYLTERQPDEAKAAQKRAKDLEQKVNREESKSVLVLSLPKNSLSIVAAQDASLFNAYVGRKAAGLLSPRIVDDFINIKISHDKAMFGENSGIMAQDYFAQAKNKARLGQYGQAADAMAKSAQIRLHKAETVKGFDRKFLEILGAGNTKAAAKYYMKDDNYVKAEPLFRSALAVYDAEARRHEDNPSDMAPADTRINLAHCLLKEGKTVEGVKEFNIGLEQAKRVVGGNLIPHHLMPVIPEFVAAQRSIGKVQDAKSLEDLYKSEVVRYGSPYDGESVYENR